MLNDPLFWILVLPGLLLGLYAQARIKLNFAKYSQVGTQGGITGAEVARRLLDSQGLQGVAIESTPGILKDHYDPRSKTLRLSQEVYFARSVAAAGIAAHETGQFLTLPVEFNASNAKREDDPKRMIPTQARVESCSITPATNSQGAIFEASCTAGTM